MGVGIFKILFTGVAMATMMHVAMAAIATPVLTPIFSNSCKDHNKLSFKALSQMVLKL